MAKLKQVPANASNKLGDSRNVVAEPNKINPCFTYKVTSAGSEKCSVPTKDVKCFITKNTKIDHATKLFVSNQISRKIYNQPAAKGNV